MNEHFGFTPLPRNEKLFVARVPCDPPVGFAFKTRAMTRGWAFVGWRVEERKGERDRAAERGPGAHDQVHVRQRFQVGVGRPSVWHGNFI